MSMRDYQHGKPRFTASRGEPHVTTNRQGKVIKTYTPLKGYWKPATCRDLNCYEYEHGWISTIPETKLQMIADIYQMRNEGKWEFTEERVDGLDPEGPALIRFTFPPGLTCFRHLGGTGHMVPVERSPVYLHRPAGRPGQTRRLEEDQFFDAFNESAYQGLRRINAG